MIAIFMDYKNIFRVTLRLDLPFKCFKLGFIEKDWSHAWFINSNINPLQNEIFN